MKRERGMAYCGLACGLCESSPECPGCRQGGCLEKEACKNYRCCRERGLAGCWECPEFPCEAPMLQKLKPRAFCAFIRTYGEERLLDCLEHNERQGVVYHEPGTVVGEYDTQPGEDAVFRLLLQGREE